MHFAPLAAQAIAAALAQNRDALARYADAVKRDFSTYLKQRLAQYTKEQRWPASPFLQRRHIEPAAMTELPHHAAPACAAERSVAAGRLAHVECETPLCEKPRRDTDCRRLPKPRKTVLDTSSLTQKLAEVNPTQKQFSLNRAASKEQFPISRRIVAGARPEVAIIKNGRLTLL